MKWDSIIPAILAFLAAFLLPFFLSKRKRESHKKLKEFRHHLLGIGVKFVELDKDSEEGKFEKKLSWGQKSEGIIALEDRNIDFISVISVASQYGVNYFIEYMVKSTFNIREGADLNKFKGSIWIIPEPKHGYTRIKTNYNLPSSNMFYAIDSIAKYIKSGI